MFESKFLGVAVVTMLAFILCSSLFYGQSIGTQIVPIGAEEVVEEISFLPGNVLLIFTVVLSCVAVCAKYSLHKCGWLSFFGKRIFWEFFFCQR